MEEELLKHDDRAGSPSRMLAKAFTLGIIAGLVGLGINGVLAAAGAFAGAGAAALYGSAFLRSHLARADGRERFFDPVIARQAMLRFLVLAAAAVGTYMLGRVAVIGFLTAFLACFAILVGTEIPRAMKQLKTPTVNG